MRTSPTEQITRLLLCVSLTAPEPDAVRGVIESEYLPFPVPFLNLADLVIELDRVSAYLGFPQAWEERRSLYQNTSASGDQERLLELWQRKGSLLPESRGGRRHQFTVQVICRQHVSLQGLLQIGLERIAFRSALELLGLIHEALELDLFSKQRPSASARPLPA